MTKEQKLKNMSVPAGRIDVVLDTDAYNEIDDQFAIAYLLRSTEKLNTKAIYAAPFYNNRAKSVADGMEKSYNEILKILELTGTEQEVYKGSDKYLEDEKTPVISAAAEDLARRANDYSPENPLYVVAIGAITNIASAILINPAVAENTVVVWLGGHALHYRDIAEFNMRQDIAAARVVIESGVPFVQLPCRGVVSAFTVSGAELEFWFKNKNPLADYLAQNAINEAETYAKGKAWTRVIWDVTAVAWLLNDNNKFMMARMIPAQLPEYNRQYSEEKQAELPIQYIYYIERDALLNDLINKLCK